MKAIATHFDPPTLTMQFDPLAPVLEQWRTVGIHGFDNGVISLQIPDGFTSDLGSIPWFLRWFVSPSGALARAFVFHDMAYRLQPVDDRSLMDLIIRIIGRTDKVNPLKAWFCWAAVRVGGGSTWKAHKARLDKNREQHRVAMGVTAGAGPAYHTEGMA